MNNDLLLVYGSLLDDNNEFANYLRHNANRIGPAVFKGRLYDCGEYPGAVADNNGYNIKGSIYQLRDTTSALIMLDDYEGFGPEQEQPNLFIRKSITVTTGVKMVTCWIYLYNLPVESLREITSGDYLAYIRT
ncbi:gamma-glutamylcyclotransferase family protein [Mucilaginibacter sp. HD30]